MNLSSNSPKTLIAGEALAANRRVKLSSGTAVYSDAGEDFIGVTLQAAASGAPVAVRMLGEGTLAIESAGAVTAYAAVYGANDGKVDDVASGKCIGWAQEAASAGAKVIEIVPSFAGPAAAMTASALTDNSGGAASLTVATISDGNTANAIASIVAELNKLRTDLIGA